MAGRRQIQHDQLKVRYDERSERFRDCRWCSGRGCLYCQSEADKAYKAVPTEPIATFDTTTPEGQQAARDFLNKITGKRDDAGS